MPGESRFSDGAFVRLRGFRVRLGSGRVFEIGVSIVGSMTRRKSDTHPIECRAVVDKPNANQLELKLGAGDSLASLCTEPSNSLE